jgi:hypothetical protein
LVEAGPAHQTTAAQPYAGQGRHSEYAPKNEMVHMGFRATKFAGDLDYGQNTMFLLGRTRITTVG